MRKQAVRLANPFGKPNTHSLFSYARFEKKLAATAAAVVAVVVAEEAVVAAAAAAAEDQDDDEDPRAATTKTITHIVFLLSFRLTLL
jgi:hypothetical protein